MNTIGDLFDTLIPPKVQAQSVQNFKDAAEVSKKFAAIEMGHASAQLAADRAGQEWQSLAMSHLRAYASQHAEMQCYMVRLFAENRGLPPAPSNTAWGAIMLKGAKSGIIRKTDRMVPTDHAASHGRDQRVWRSLVCAI